MREKKKIYTLSCLDFMCSCYMFNLKQNTKQFNIVVEIFLYLFRLPSKFLILYYTIQKGIRNNIELFICNITKT